MQLDRQIHDKVFCPFISKDEIAHKVKNLSSEIQKDYLGEEILFIAILNGAFMFASDLLKEIPGNIQISFVKVSSYIGAQSSGRVDELIGLNTELKGKHVVILEDIVDTGITIDKVISLLKRIPNIHPPLPAYSITRKKQNLFSIEHAKICLTSIRIWKINWFVYFGRYLPMIIFKFTQI